MTLKASLLLVPQEVPHGQILDFFFQNIFTLSMFPAVLDFETIMKSQGPLSQYEHRKIIADGCMIIWRKIN